MANNCRQTLAAKSIISSLLVVLLLCGEMVLGAEAISSNSADLTSATNDDHSESLKIHVSISKDPNAISAAAKIEISAQNFNQLVDLPAELANNSDGMFKIAIKDINFDGWDDFSITQEHAAKQKKSFYWVYNEKIKQFEFIGQYSNLKVDRQRKRLYSFERDSNDIHSYQANCYAIQDGKLVLISTEKHEATPQAGVYKKSVFQVENGQEKLIKVEYAYSPTGT